jgi:CDP-diglyceride synthetase
MKEKIKIIQSRFKNNPKVQEQLQKMKPKKTIWGFLGIILFFFVPEILNVLYYQEINNWVAQNAHIYYPPNIADKVIWLVKHTFNGEVSYVNLALGFGFLWWFYK